MKKKSINAEAVAKDVIEAVRKGQKVNLQKIQQKHGYTAKSAKSMKAKRTKTYQRIMNDFAKELEKERARAASLLSKRIGKAKYRDLIDAIDKLTKNHQLLTGGDTERLGLNLTDLFNKSNDGG